MDDAVARFALLPPGSRVLCALSGGPDSVCMTHWLAGRAAELSVTVAAAHFSHGLRPESAEAERALCQRLCDRLEIPLFCGEGYTPAFAAAHGLGEEEAARTLRRAFLEQTARDWGADVIATGHHLEDSAETLLLNLIRGSGSAGLQGIPPRQENRIRPLILHTREDILAYDRLHGLEYVSDPTNTGGENARARLRRQVFPPLEALNPAAARHLARTALEQWERDEPLRRAALELCALARCTGQTAELPARALTAASPEAAARALQALQRQIGGHMLERPHLEALLALCRGNDPSARLDLPGSRAFRRYEALVLTTLPEQTAPPPVTLLPERPTDFGPWQLLLTREAGQEGLPLTLFPGELPLTVRSRRPGDGIASPFGTKSLKKLLIERKIPKDMRDNLPILCNNKEILAVGGLRTAWRIKRADGVTYRLICRRKEL